jgi:hypothetical protein
MKYIVSDNGQVRGEFDTFEGAIHFSRNNLGFYRVEGITVNVPFDYDGYGDILLISTGK